MFIKNGSARHPGRNSGSGLLREGNAVIILGFFPAANSLMSVLQKVANFF
jgi:hypothetical protein